MRRVLGLASRGVTSGAGLPYGAVVVRAAGAWDVIAEAHNEVRLSGDPTAHAELLAIRRACTALGTLELNDCILYTNVAPCCMCMSAALWATVNEVRYLVGNAGVRGHRPR